MIMQADSLRERPEGVTIAIPNWNHEYLLGRSIDSALRALAALSVRDIPAEVLVIDDFSRDGSSTLLRQLEALYFEQGLRVYFKPYNSGLADTRNLILHQARYRYVLFLDADNEVLPDNLHIFYRSIRETKAALVYGNLIVLQDEIKPDKLHSSQSVQADLFDSNYIDAFALVDVFQLLELGGYTPASGVEDWLLLMQLSVNGRLVVFVPVEIGYYHMLPSSMLADLLDSPELAHQKKRFKRIFNQFDIRKEIPLRTRHLRYHPDLGFI
jgi:glycosyltransferase involved in cell wall biosynthesis